MCICKKEDLKPVVVILYEKISIQGSAHPAGPQREGKQGTSVQSEQANVENLGKLLVYKVQTLELELRRKLRCKRLNNNS